MSPIACIHRWLFLVLALLALGGCATGPDPRDPYEPFNRSVMRFNDELDKAVLKPVATAYRDVLPSPVRTGVNNFFGNLGDAWSAFNSLLQLKVQNAAESGMRFAVNSTLGLYGLLDIASEAGLERHKEDFGQTLGRWGVPSGPYVVIPLLGPSTVRDTAALPVDYQGDLVRRIDASGTRDPLLGLRIVDTRANLLRAGNVLEEVALDRYTFVRDAYLQRRRSQILEGEPDLNDTEDPEDPARPEK